MNIFLKNLLFAASLVLAGVVQTAQAERYVMVSHSDGTDPFWPVVERGGRDAAAHVKVKFEHLFSTSGDSEGMARLIESTAAGKPDGMIVSIPSAAAVGPAIRAAIAAGIPVVTVNTGLDEYQALGSLMHIGQPEAASGQVAAQRAKREGAFANGGKALCLTKEPFNKDLITRCQSYFQEIGAPLNMIDVSTDMVQAKTRIAAALQADSTITVLHAVASDICEAADAAARESQAKVYLSCQDLSAGVLNLIKSGRVAFSIDQQPYLQGYLPVILLHLYNTNAGMLPGANVISGPSFVDKRNVDAIGELAGITR